MHTLLKELKFNSIAKLRLALVVKTIKDLADAHPDDDLVLDFKSNLQSMVLESLSVKDEGFAIFEGISLDGKTKLIVLQAEAEVCFSAYPTSTKLSPAKKIGFRQ